jgi:hypothetical protein
MYRDVVGAVDELAWMRYKTTFRSTLDLPILVAISTHYGLSPTPSASDLSAKSLAPNHMRDEKAGDLPLWENFCTLPLTKISSDGYVAGLSALARSPQL